MRKLFLGFSMLLISQFSIAQISDNAVIPVSVTLNSILRLTVVSGGNIQFVVNSIDDYTTGIANSARYTTRFNVASSRDFDVFIYSENATFVGTDYESAGPTGNTLALNNVGFLIDASAGSAVIGTNNAVTVVALLSTFVTPMLDAVDADRSDVNTFDIRWRLGTAEGTMAAGSLLSQSIPADNYVTNVFINVQPN